MILRTGTSGFCYKEWKGAFYPDDLPAGDMLAYYGERLAAVEINNTFYRLPKPEVLESWAAHVPEHFRFALKASRRITHFKRLQDATDETEYLVKTARILGDRLGALLFQLPPLLKKDAARLAEFLHVLPADVPAAFEFRHDSWFDEEVVGLLTEHDRALCIADTGEEGDAPFTATASWGYARLRRPDYSPTDLARWASRIRGQGWSHAYVFFKHEDAGAGPRMAAEFEAIFAGAE